MHYYICEPPPLMWGWMYIYTSSATIHIYIILKINTTEAGFSLPFFRMASSLVHDILNFSSKMAAAISSGSSKISLKRFFKPSWMASTSGLENFKDGLIRSSFVFSWVRVGRSHPICMLVSACRISIALATGLMVAEYSAKKANSDGLSLWHTKRFNSVWESDRLFLYNVTLSIANVNIARLKWSSGGDVINVSLASSVVS